MRKGMSSTPADHETLRVAILAAFTAGAEIDPALSHPFRLALGVWEFALSSETMVMLLTTSPRAMDSMLSAVQGLIEEGYLYRKELDRTKAAGQELDPTWKAQIEDDLDFFVARLGHDLSAWAIERVLQIRHARMQAGTYPARAGSP